VPFTSFCMRTMSNRGRSSGPKTRTTFSRALLALLSAPWRTPSDLLREPLLHDTSADRVQMPPRIMSRELRDHEIIETLKQLLPGVAVAGGSFAKFLPRASSLARSDRRSTFMDIRRLATDQCISEALRLTGATPEVVPNNQGGDRAWPPGLVGSVSHKGTVVAVAVAQASTARSLGIDLERIDRSLVPVQGLIAADGLPRDVDLEKALTMVFSTKESVFKAYYPRRRQRIGFEDIRIAWTRVSDLQWRATAEARRELYSVHCRWVGRWVASVAVSHSIAAS
jgi:4'-phosphopantetheinyl transferase EntD